MSDFVKPWELPKKEEEKKEPDFVPFSEAFPPARDEISDAPADEAGIQSYEVKEEEKPELKGLASVYAEDDIDKQKKKCLEEITKILRKHDGMESNIDLKHEYWDLTALYRKLYANP